MLSTFLGIDYGAKTSGNTIICWHNGRELLLYTSDKKDADLFILDFVAQRSPSLTQIFLDAPLSLPAVYYATDGFSNYHYRACDIALKAMSPMFLGGLTARAIELKHRLETQNIQTYEVYPKAIAQVLLADQYHKKLSSSELKRLSDLLTQHIPEIQLNHYPQNQHQFDAMLAWISGFRFLNQQHQVFGHLKEGIIIV
jgi:uncharacterized protein